MVEYKIQDNARANVRVNGAKNFCLASNAIIGVEYLEKQDYVSISTASGMFYMWFLTKEDAANVYNKLRSHLANDCKGNLSIEVCNNTIAKIGDLVFQQTSKIGY